MHSNQTTNIIYSLKLEDNYISQLCTFVHNIQARPDIEMVHIQSLNSILSFANVIKAETPAFILGLLTSVGGITGYVRTGSVPSIAAGLTVGALVRSSPHSLHHQDLRISDTNHSIY